MRAPRHPTSTMGSEPVVPYGGAIRRPNRVRVRILRVWALIGLLSRHLRQLRSEPRHR